MPSQIHIAQNGTLTSGKPIRLVAPRMMIRPHTGDSRPMYVVTPDGQRVLVVVPGDDAPLPVTVVLNWMPRPRKP